MRLRTVLVGLTALVCGLLAAVGVYSLESPSDVETASIVAVTTDVQRGTSLTAEMLKLKTWPTGFVPDGSMTRVEDAVGRTVWTPLVAGEPVLEGKLAAKGAGRGMAALIPSGMRAVTIQASNVSTGVAGFVLPGNKVDVLLTLSQMSGNDTTGGGSTMTLLQNIEILAVDQRIEAPSENVVDPKELRSVTLLVTPLDAAKLDLGQNKGVLSLALRNPEDSRTTDDAKATITGLREGPGGTWTAMRPSEDPRLDHVAVVPSPTPDPVEAASPGAAPSEGPAAEAAPSVRRIRTLRGVSSGSVQIRRPGR